MRFAIGIFGLVYVLLVASNGVAQDWTIEVKNGDKDSGSVHYVQCPGGVCPTPQRVRTVRQPVASVFSLPKVAYSRPVSGHWTHDGEPIEFHLRTDHRADLARLGIAVEGMSREELLTLHDSIHEGTARGYNVPTPDPVPDMVFSSPMVYSYSNSYGVVTSARYSRPVGYTLFGTRRLFGANGVHPFRAIIGRLFGR